MRVVTPREMAKVDNAAVEKEGIPGLELMERAGECAAAAARDMLGEAGLAGAMGMEAPRVAIWCGKGNNGGDGLVIARLLALSRVEVDVFLLCEASEVKGDARVNLERIASTSATMHHVTDSAGILEFGGSGKSFDLVVDAIFGTGFSGRADDVFADAIGAINSSGCPVLSVDIPSGVAGDTGAVSGVAVKAKRTVTFAAPKVGLVQYPGAGLAGEMTVADIGIPEHLLESVPTSQMYLTTSDEAAQLIPARRADAHKRQCGSVLVVGGAPGLSGAAAMCARAALRAGAGLVTLAVPESIHDIMEVKLTEVMTHPLPQSSDGTLALEAAEVIAELSDGFDVLALGPGIGTSPETVRVVREIVPVLYVPLVLDADGLNAMIGEAALFEQREGPAVLTPHPGEMARLLESKTATVQADRLTAALDAAARWGVVVILKGAGTVIAEPGGMTRVNPTGNPGMATAGMGDVLTGVVAALIAQGLGPFEASVAGAYYHGYAADLVANMDAMVGMLAGDVIRYLPLAMRGPEN